MNRLILITLLAIFTLGNSAGGLGGLVFLAGGVIVWGIIGFLRR